MRLLRRLRDERGVTLVELLVVTAILGVVLGSVVLVLARGNNASADLNARFQDQGTARVALERMRLDLRCAKTAAGGGASVTLTLPATCGGGGSVSWCVLSSGGWLKLFRQAAATCTTAGAAWADRVAQTATPNSFFTVQAATAASLASVVVDLPVAHGRARRFELRDTVVLRNSSRG